MSCYWNCRKRRRISSYFRFSFPVKLQHFRSVAGALGPKSLRISPAVRCLYWSKTRLKMFLSLIFFKPFKKKNISLFNFILKMFSPSIMFLKFFLPMITWKIQPQNRPKSSPNLNSCSIKINLPPCDFSIMTLHSNGFLFKVCGKKLNFYTLL